MEFQKNIVILNNLKNLFMKFPVSLFVIITLIFTLFVMSCKNSDNKSENSNEETENTIDYDFHGEKLVVTDKIMYDVTISNDIIGDRSKNGPDWFWENLPTPESDEFIKTLLVDAYSGKLKTYYYDMTGDYESFDEIPSSELKAYMDEVLTYKFEVVDTTIKRFKTENVEITLDYRNVKKLRFLEEWFVADGEFYKKVIAVAPYFVIEHPRIESMHAVYFWIMLDDSNE